VIRVPRDAAGMRVDRFLAGALARLAGLDAAAFGAAGLDAAAFGAAGLDAAAFGAAGVPSRAALQRWIDAGWVTTDGRACRSADKLREGDELRVRLADVAAPRTTARPEEGIAFRVLHTDDDLIVVDKPAGLVVHPARGHASGTLVNGLLALGAFDDPSDAADGKDREGHLRPGIVHRLDRGTSGVMVIARTGRAREALKAQFAEHSILREYEAIAVGHVASRTFDTLHGRHPTDRLRFTTRVRTGKRAVTHVRAIAPAGGCTHVVCRLETGRTHQIRVHLAEAGHPILGDPLYGSAPRDPRVRAIASSLGHQALHARLLGFVHPTTGAHLRFETAPPDDFAGALAALRAG